LICFVLVFPAYDFHARISGLLRLSQVVILCFQQGALQVASALLRVSGQSRLAPPRSPPTGGTGSPAGACGICTPAGARTAVIFVTVQRSTCPDRTHAHLPREDLFLKPPPHLFLPRDTRLLNILPFIGYIIKEIPRAGLPGKSRTADSESEVRTHRRMER